MKKEELIEYVANNAATTKKHAKELVEIVFEGIATGLKKDKEVVLAKIGKFSVKTRSGLVPGTKKPYTSNVIKFTAYDGFKGNVDGTK